jgi:hypothetical protein
VNGRCSGRRYTRATLAEGYCIGSRGRPALRHPLWGNPALGHPLWGNPALGHPLWGNPALRHRRGQQGTSSRGDLASSRGDGACQPARVECTFGRGQSRPIKSHQGRSHLPQSSALLGEGNQGQLRAIRGDRTCASRVHFWARAIKAN